MNLILCGPEELSADGHICLRDDRARHILTVLRSNLGDTIRLGIIDGPRGVGTVLTADADEVVLQVVLEATPPERPRLDVMLALPRPKVLKRLWAQIAALGVSRIILTNAARVERCYFDSHVLDSAFIRTRILEGLQQAGDTRLPRVSIHRRLKPLVEDEVDSSSDADLRLVLHPKSPRGLTAQMTRTRPHRLLLAIGPEGGWTDYELGLLTAHRFTAVRLQHRVLRSDTACIAAVAVAQEALR